MIELEKLLSGGDLRSTGKGISVIPKIKNQADFDGLFNFLFHTDRIIVMRAADTVEKITITNPQYLTKHKKKTLELFYVAKNKELKWHLAQLLPRLNLNDKEFIEVWEELIKWARNRENSRIVRVSAVQALYELVKQKKDLWQEFNLITMELEKENIPSINARIRNIRKERI